MSAPTEAGTPLTIVPVPYKNHVAAQLVAALQADHTRRYGHGDEQPTDAAEFDPPRGLFLVAYLGATPIACGGYRVISMTNAGTEVLMRLARQTVVAEIKRMYVMPSARGRGLARQILAALEAHAQTAGVRMVILESGMKNAEALNLYASSGYQRISGYSIYRDKPRNRAFAKELPSISEAA